MRKLVLSVLCIVFVLAGCASNYERDETPGEIVKISYEQMHEMMDNGETFLVMVSQAQCEHCALYRKMLREDYLPYHHVIVYELDLQHQSKDVITMFDTMKNEVKEMSNELAAFEGTPTTLVFKDGQFKECITGPYVKEEDYDGISFKIEDFEELVVMYHLDAK